jgi:hypothetical protein
VSRWLGSFAGKAALSVACSAVIFAVPILLFGATPLLSAMILAVIYAAIATAWIAEFMFRKSYPDLFRKFESKPQSRKPAGDGNE